VTDPHCPLHYLTVVRYWRGYLSVARCKLFAYGPAVATATPSSLGSLIIQIGLTFLVRAYACPEKEAVKQMFVFHEQHASFLGDRL